MEAKLTNSLFSILLFALLTSTSFATPPFSGSPRIDKPPLLNWKHDFIASDPDLTAPGTNMVFDLHAAHANCDMVLSTAGNYHMALTQLWYDHFLPNNPRLKNWFFTTSPPVAVPQIKNNILTIGNWKSSCRPSIAVGPKGLMDSLDLNGLSYGERIPVIQNQGNVILVKNGNPKNISSIWDLGRLDVRVVTSNPYTEPGSFGNYSDSIYNIALNQPGPGTADQLFERIFGVASIKWLSGERIHHREVPWSVAYGHADAGLMFYHLALYVKRSFPHLFDIVPLGGTVDLPQPLAGNKVGKLFAVRIKAATDTAWTPAQEYFRERLLAQYVSPLFSRILHSHGILRPPEFVEGDTKPVAVP